MNNTFFLIGRITKDLELRTTSSNKSYCEVNLAVQNGKDDTTFIRVLTWNKIAETVSQYCRKGDLIGVQGSIKNHNWEKDGIKHYEYSFVVNKVSFLSSSKEKKEVKEEPKSDPFEEFGNEISIDEFLD